MLRLICLLFFCASVFGYKNFSREAVFLSKYIENGDLEGARKASYVQPFLEKDVESYAGFLTVDKYNGSHIYFWFFPSEGYKENAPVVVWLQGGPGTSSLVGLFKENGVYYLDPYGQIMIRDYYWSRIANIIYIDSPVGAGFSFTESNNYAKDLTQVGEDLNNAINQFFQVFPQYLTNDFYIFGESYGGRSAVAMAYSIHFKKNQINLKGVAVGNAFIDPPNMLDVGPYLYQIGLIDGAGRRKFNESKKLITNELLKNDFASASKMIDKLYGELLRETGITSFSNYLSFENDPSSDLSTFLNRTRKLLHVGDFNFTEKNPIVHKYLQSDLMRSVIPMFKVLVENYQVLVYSGQLDMVCPYPLTVKYLKKLQWSGARKYRRAKREQWRVDGELAGYVKRAQNLTEVLVRNAGRSVPQDQPWLALRLFQSFVYNQSYSD